MSNINNMTGLSFFINDVEVSVDSEIDLELNIKNKSVMRLTNCLPKDGNYSKLWSVNDYSRLEVIRDDATIFEGIIKLTSVVDITDKMSSKGLSIQAVDYKEWLSCHDPISFAVVLSRPVDVIKRTLTFIDKYKFELGTTNFKTDEIIRNWAIQDMTAYDIFNYIGNYTNSKWSVSYNNNKYKINFYEYDSLPQVEQDLLLTKNDNNYSVNNNNGEIIKIEHQGARVVDYVNKVVVKSKNLIVNNNKENTFRGNGNTKEFIVNDNIADVLAIFEGDMSGNWVEKEIDLYEYKDILLLDWFYKRGEAVIYQNPASTTLTSNQQLRVIYNYVSSGFYAAENRDEASRIAKLHKVDDVFWRTKSIEKNDITSYQDLIKFAEGELEKYTIPYRPLIITTKHEFKDWDLNKKVRVIVDPAEESDLDETYIIDRIKIKGQAYKKYSNLEYIYTLNPSKNDNQPINFYDNPNIKDSVNPFTNTTVDLLSNVVANKILNIENVDITYSDDTTNKQIKSMSLITNNNKIVKTIPIDSTKKITNLTFDITQEVIPTGGDNNDTRFNSK